VARDRAGDLGVQEVEYGIATQRGSDRVHDSATPYDHRDKYPKENYRNIPLRPLFPLSLIPIEIYSTITYPYPNPA
jgi:hypothetical protein